MADYKLEDTDLIAVANAIRTKGGTVAPLEWPSGYISAIQAIPTPVPEIVSWATGTDEQIVALIQAAHDGTIDLQQDAGWAVGDVRTISIDGTVSPSISAQTLDIVITSFNDYMNCGCVLQFDFKKCLYEYVNFNNVKYESSNIYTNFLPTLINCLPQWLRDALITFDVLVSAGTASSTIITVTGNKLALRSEVEMIGTASKSYSGEGSIIPYYTTSSNRIKPFRNSGSVAYWTRSPSKWIREYVIMSSDGTGSHTSGMESSQPIAPFGCL